MPNIATVLKDEVVRLARKEVKREVFALRTQVVAQRRSLAALKKQMAEVQRLAKEVARAARLAKPASTSPSRPGRFSAKGLRVLRARLGLSAPAFGRLIGVSAQSVYNWETELSRPRDAMLVTLQQLRSLNKREAAKRLASLPD